MCEQKTFQQINVYLSLFTQQLCEDVSPPAQLSTSDLWSLPCKMDHATFISAVQVCRCLFLSFCLLQTV